MAKPLFFAGNHSRDHSKLGDLQQQTGLTGILDHLVTEELSETLGRADGGRLLTLVLGQRLGHRLVLRDLKQPEQKHSSRTTERATRSYFADSLIGCN